MNNMEFLNTKDPLFFNKPPTQNLTFRFKQENVILTYRAFGGSEPPQNLESRRLAPYEDNESMYFMYLLANS